MRNFSVKLPHVILAPRQVYTLEVYLEGFNGSAELALELVLDGKEAYLLVLEDVGFEGGLARVGFKTPEVEGEGTLKVMVRLGEEWLEENLPVVVAKPPSHNDKLRVVFVWHFHQAPAFYPDGSMHSPWAIKYVIEDFASGFRGGPYAVHLEIHRRHPRIKDVDHVSPSLLSVWNNLLRRGDVDENVRARVSEVMEGFKRLAETGSAEFLGSVYAHTVQGYVLKLFEEEGLGGFIRELIGWELSLGLKTVAEKLGVEPRGVWTPEMSWCDELADLYSSKGVKYTVLCDQHFSKAVGELADIYEPYRLEGTDIVVFFRDRALSDWISFLGDPGSEEKADEEARRFVVALHDRLWEKPGGVVVIALDGENWMVMPEPKPYTPLFLDRLYSYLENDSDYFETVTLSEALEKVPPRRRITRIPRGSWIGLSETQWVEGEKIFLWTYVLERLKWVAGYFYALPAGLREEMLRDSETPLFKAFLAAAISIDSDYFWYAWKEPEKTVIRTWADEAERISKEELGKVFISDIHLVNGNLRVELTNRADYPLRVTLKVLSDEELQRTTVTLKANSRVTVHLPRGDELILEAPPVTLRKLLLNELL